MLFTVFTPTYNRANTLARVYESLRSQTFRDFEWLIVDDGSTDDTKILVERWQAASDNDFPIRYIWQENQHKKVAHNRAISEARGDLLVVFDSDDRCVPEALDRFRKHWESIPEQQKSKFWCVCGLCQTEEGEVVGDYFPYGSWIDSNSLEIRYRYKVAGEKWGAMRTDVLKSFPFRQDIPGLVPEGTVWNAIAREYRTRFFNEPIRIYAQDVPGLIARKGEVVNASENSAGALYEKKMTLEHDIQYFKYAPVQFFMEGARLTRFWLHCSRKWRQRLGYWPKTSKGKVLVLVGAPLGMLMWLRDCRAQAKFSGIKQQS
jgi:glycosyltransferase involved in cell wall biosynthesis